MNWYADPAEYTAADYDGREVRIWKGLKAHDALLANPAALRNAALGAARMPFAFTANRGVVMADKIA
jgi:hypothetical protein